MQKIRKAVIPAAGFGTRFLPATKATPKEMLPIVDKPTIHYIVEEALASGIEEILIISGHAKRAIEDHFDSAPALEMELEKKGKTELLKMVRETGAIDIHYIRQQHMRGLGDAVLCARAFVQDEPFAVLLGDDVVYNGEGRPALKQLIDVYNATGSSVLGCQTVPEDKVSSYGIVRGSRRMTRARCACSTWWRSLPSRMRRVVWRYWAGTSSHRRFLTFSRTPCRARAMKSS